MQLQKLERYIWLLQRTLPNSLVAAVKQFGGGVSKMKRWAMK
jgi:hypothetical protein